MTTKSGCNQPFKNPYTKLLSRAPVTKEWEMEYVLGKVKEIMDQREEILTAFIAKYGYEPDEVVQIETVRPDGTRTWHLDRRKKS